MFEDDETRPARDLVGPDGAFNLRTELVRFTAYDVHGEPPIAGESAYMSRFYPADPAYDGPEYIRLRSTLWGDYIGDTVTRSNHRSLIRDYPDTFVETTGDYWSRQLLLPADAEISTYLFEEIRQMEDEYPLYDESDHSELEAELAQECWVNYGVDDFRREIEAAGGDVTEVPDTGDGSLTEMFNDAAYRGVVDYPVFEDAVSCYWPGLVDAAKEVAAGL